jgi:hypothetical protein
LCYICIIYATILFYSVSICSYFKWSIDAIRVCLKNYSKISNLEPYKLISLTLLFSLTVGIHGLSHLGLETKYNFFNIISIEKNIA